MAPETSVTPNHGVIASSSVPTPSQPEVRPYRLMLDDKGRIIPPTQAELADRAKAVERMFVELAKIPANPIEEDQAIYRAIDAERPDRPLFEGMY